MGEINSRKFDDSGDVTLRILKIIEGTDSEQQGLVIVQTVIWLKKICQGLA